MHKRMSPHGDFDHMGEAINLVNNFKVEKVANDTHYEVGKEIRKTIKKLGGTMPEDLPTPDKSLKELEKESKDENKNIEVSTGNKL